MGLALIKHVSCVGFGAQVAASEPLDHFARRQFDKLDFVFKDRTIPFPATARGAGQ